MASVPSKDVFSTDYSDKQAVIALAKRFGKGMTVCFDAAFGCYNIIHTSRENELLRGRKVVHRT